MIPGQPVLRFVCTLFLSFSALGAYAQPTLPDLAGATDKGVVILSWVCQYEGIRSITVLRSQDSTSINQKIGNVQALGKGVQAFADAHPVAGKNFYKLAIVFKSGLTWSSNRVSVFIDKAALEQARVELPANDSIQHFVVTEQKPPDSKPDSAGKSSTSKPMQNGTTIDTLPKHRVLISFDFDSTAISPQSFSSNTAGTAIPRKRITVAFDDQSTIAGTEVVSRFIYTDKTTGHVDMNLPDDVATHHYSVKFYNSKGNMIFEVPKIHTQNIIIDKRNFQKKGIYKFVLRRDVVELESGYVTVDLSPPSPKERVK
jgi:hypothetical protein